MKKYSTPSKTTLLAASLILTISITTNCYAQVNYKNQLTQMFHEMVEKKRYFQDAKLLREKLCVILKWLTDDIQTILWLSRQGIQKTNKI